MEKKIWDYVSGSKFCKALIQLKAGYSVMAIMQENNLNIGKFQETELIKGNHSILVNECSSVFLG